VDGHSDLVARRHHLHRRILQECREAYLPQGRVSEGSGPSVQLESRRKRTAARSTSTKEKKCDESAFKALVRQAIALNGSGKSKPSKKAKSRGIPRRGGKSVRKAG